VTSILFDKIIERRDVGRNISEKDS
jgi:hypothetical protein